MLPGIDTNRGLLVMAMLAVASTITLLSNLTYLRSVGGIPYITFLSSSVQQPTPNPVSSLYHASSAIPAEKEPVRDWFQAARGIEPVRLGLHTRNLRMVAIDKSGTQCLRACYHSCNRSLPSLLSEALEMVYFDPKGMKRGQDRFNVACAKLVVTAPRMVFEFAHGEKRKRQMSLYGAPYFPKNEWTLNLRRYAKKNNCDPDLFESFDLRLKHQCEALLAKRKEGGMFFWKDPHSFGGKSIEIKSVKEKFPNPEARCPMSGLFAQRYANPLWLLNKKKFDNRVYVFVLSFHPLIVFIRPGHIHASLFDFNITSTFKPVHVTNGHIQEPYCKGCNNEDWQQFIKPNAMLLKDLMSKHGVEEGQALFKQMVEGQIRSVVQLIVSSRNLFRITQDKAGRNQHGMLGLDMLVTEDLRWYILDVNRYPGWRPGPRHIVRDNYFANVEAYTMLAEYVANRKLDPVSRNQRLVKGKPRFWLEVYNENFDVPSPYFAKGECTYRPGNRSFTDVRSKASTT